MSPPIHSWNCLCLQLNEWSQMRKEIEQLKLLFSAKDQLKAPPRGEAEKEKRQNEFKSNDETATRLHRLLKILNILMCLIYWTSCMLRRDAAVCNKEISGLLSCPHRNPGKAFHLPEDFSSSILSGDLLMILISGWSSLRPRPGKRATSTWLSLDPTTRCPSRLRDWALQHNRIKCCDMLWLHVTKIHIDLL